MELFSSALGAILPLFGLVLIGYVSKKLRILHAADAQILSRFVVELALPALIISAFVQHHVARAYFTLPLTLWIASAVSLAAVLIVCRVANTKLPTTGAMILVTCFGNTGYMGYPITAALFPKLMPATVICDQLGMALVLYPSVALLSSIFGRKGGQTLAESLIRFARSPLFIALIAGLALSAIPPLHAPGGAGPSATAFHDISRVGRGLMIVVDALAASCIPVILIAIGLLLRPSTLKLHWREVTVVGVLRLGLAPVVAWLAARYLFGLHGELLTLCVLENAVPSSAAATVLAGQYDMDGSLAVAAFFALTIASAVTIPLALTLLR